MTIKMMSEESEALTYWYLTAETVPVIAKPVIFYVRSGYSPFLLMGARTDQETFLCHCCGSEYELHEVPYWTYQPPMPPAMGPRVVE